MPQEINVKEPGVRTRDNVTVERYDLRPVRRTEPRFDDLSKESQLRALSYWKPTSTQTTSNITSDHLHEYVPKRIDPAEEADDPPKWVGLGSNTALGFFSTDSSLNAEVGRIRITDTGSVGDTFTITEFIASTELNGESIAELAIIAASENLWNHAPIDEPFTKTRDEGVIINVDIPFGDASEFP